MVRPDSPLRILSIQNREEDFVALKSEAEQIGQLVEIQKAMNKVEIEHFIRTQAWGMILCEFNLKGFTLEDVLELVRKYNASVPFVLISVGLGEETVADAMRAGVEDIILRSHPARLGQVLKRLSREQDSRVKEEKAQKIASEAFAVKEQMLAIVSHDIKNPLSAINLEAQMLLRAADRAEKSIFSEEVKIQANRILKTTLRMKSLIADLLDRSKAECSLQTLQRGEVHFHRLVQEAVDSLRPIASEKGVAFDIRLEEGSPYLGDRSKLFQVFSNLLSNAVKFSPPGKIVRIIGRETAREFLFSIEDSGSGLTPSGFKKVFNKFWTGGDGKSSGTGLGLFIAKTIVEAHGGSIGVENLPEGGASFQFRLPKSPQVSQLAFEQLLDADDGRKLILIVDDDEDLREVMVWVLEKEGFHVRSFSSPVRALKELAQMKLKPDLLIVDFHMDELNGNELVRRVRKLPGLEELPVFLITASPLEAEASRGPDLYEEVITKPVDLEGLVKSASKCTNAPSAEQSSI